MKLFKKIKGWIPIALLCSAVASLITLGPTMEKNFSTTWITIQVLVTAATFIGVSMVGPVIDYKIEKR